MRIRRRPRAEAEGQEKINRGQEAKRKVKIGGQEVRSDAGRPRGRRELGARRSGAEARKPRGKGRRPDQRPGGHDEGPGGHQ